MFHHEMSLSSNLLRFLWTWWDWKSRSEFLIVDWIEFVTLNQFNWEIHLFWRWHWFDWNERSSVCSTVENPPIPNDEIEYEIFKWTEKPTMKINIRRRQLNLLSLSTILKSKIERKLYKLSLLIPIIAHFFLFLFIAVTFSLLSVTFYWVGN